LGGNTAKYTLINDAALKVVLTRKKKKNFIKPQYNSSLNTQHCGRLSEKTNVHHAGHLNKKKHTDRKTDNLRTQNYKERKDSSEITQYDCDTGISNTMSSYEDTSSK